MYLSSYVVLPGNRRFNGEVQTDRFLTFQVEHHLMVEAQRQEETEGIFNPNPLDGDGLTL